MAVTESPVNGWRDKNPVNVQRGLWLQCNHFGERRIAWECDKPGRARRIFGEGAAVSEAAFRFGDGGAAPTSLPAALGSDLGLASARRRLLTAPNAQVATGETETPSPPVGVLCFKWTHLRLGATECGISTAGNPVSSRRTKWCHWHHLPNPGRTGLLLDRPLMLVQALRGCSLTPARLTWTVVLCVIPLSSVSIIRWRLS